jgi:hypothetical protein
LLAWVIEPFEWRRGGRLLALRRWPVPLLFAAPWADRLPAPSRNWIASFKVF